MTSFKNKVRIRKYHCPFFLLTFHSDVFSLLLFLWFVVLGSYLEILVGSYLEILVGSYLDKVDGINAFYLYSCFDCSDFNPKSPNYFIVFIDFKGNLYKVEWSFILFVKLSSLICWVFGILINYVNWFEALDYILDYIPLILDVENTDKQCF